MVYSDTPLAASRIKDTQPLIRANFQDINTLINVDHFTFGAPNQGKHKKVTLPDQGIAPAFAGSDVGLWSQVPVATNLTGVNELFIRRSDGSSTPFTAFVAGVEGWTYLPSGVLLKWGQDSKTGFNQTVTIPVDFTGNRFITDFSVLVTLRNSPGVTAPAVSYVTASFNIGVSPAAQTFRVNCFNATDGAAATVNFSYFIIGA